MDFGVSEFLKTGFNLRNHLIEFLQLSQDQLDNRLSKGVDDLASLHPGAFLGNEATDFYEKKVGNAHIIDLAAWHLNSANYIADTLRLQAMFARGNVLDFGGGIGTHALAAAKIEDVKHVYFVDLNPHNREFVEKRSKAFGLESIISVHRDIQSLGDIKFDTLICLDVLEHLPDPSSQILYFWERMSDNAIALLNWYFFKGEKGEYPFHFDDPEMIERFFITLQSRFIEVFHPLLITTRTYKVNK